MELDRKAILENKEEALVIALNESAPSDFLNSEALLSTLKQFVARGSAKEFQKLQDVVFSTLHSSLLNSSATSSLDDAPTSLAVTPSPAISGATEPAQQSSVIQHETVTSPQALALPSSIKFVAPTARQYFQQRVKPHRLGYLVKAIEGFLAAYHSITSEEALEISAGLVEESSTRSPRLVLRGISKIWLGTAGPFEGHVGGDTVEDFEDSDVGGTTVGDADVGDADVEDSDVGDADAGDADVEETDVEDSEVENVIQYIERLFRGEWVMEKNTAHNEFRQRLTCLFFAHDVDEIMRLKHPLRRGIGNITVAFKMIATRMQTKHRTIRERYCKSKGYRRLIKKGGSGSLLLLGPNVNTIWEQRLSDDEIDLLLEFRRLYLHDIETICRRLNCLVRESFKKGLISHGWSSSALKKSDTDLLKTLRVEKKMETRAFTLEPGSAKRLRENGGDELVLVQEFDDCVERHNRQPIPLGKRQKQSNHLLPDSQVSFPLFPEGVRNISAGMITTPVDFPGANTEASDLRAAQNLPEQSISGPVLQIDSQSLGIANVKARNISFSGNMQDVPYRRNYVPTTTGETDINNPNVLDENEVSDGDEDDEVSGVPSEDEALDAFNFNMNGEEWIDWALTS